MNKKLGKIIEIKEIYNKKIQPININNIDKTPRLGMAQMINVLSGYNELDGYEVKTDKNIWYVLIENGQSCCENWGYISSNDNLKDYIGKNLVEVVLTNTALNNKKIEDLYCNNDQIQFVNFKFDDGDVLQLAVYNSHNGYYGHSILVAKNDEVILNEVL